MDDPDAYAIAPDLHDGISGSIMDDVDDDMTVSVDFNHAANGRNPGAVAAVGRNTLRSASGHSVHAGAASSSAGVKLDSVTLNNLAQARVDHYALQGWYEHIVSVCEEVLDREPTNAVFRYWRAFGYSKSGQYDAAIEDLTQLQERSEYGLPVTALLLSTHNAKPNKGDTSTRHQSRPL